MNVRLASKARRHQADTEFSVRGEWFTGLEGVSTRSNSSSFAPVKERRSKATEQDLPPTTTAAEVRSEGEESIYKDRIFTCPEEGCVPKFLRYSSMRRHKHAVARDTLFDKAAVGYAQKLEEQCQAHSQLMF